MKKNWKKIRTDFGVYKDIIYEKMDGIAKLQLTDLRYEMHSDRRL